jgi:hypothetical protein
MVLAPTGAIGSVIELRDSCQERQRPIPMHGDLQAAYGARCRRWNSGTFGDRL